MQSFIPLLVGSLIMAPMAWADGSASQVERLSQDVQRLREMIEQLQATVRVQQQRIAELETARGAPQVSSWGGILSEGPPGLRSVAQSAGGPESKEPSAQAPATSPLTIAQALSPSQIGGLQRQAVSSLSAFNPEIGVLADIVGQLSESSADGEGNDKLSARETELVFGHPIDPYSRLDVTATCSDFEAASLEEAYVTHWGLPWELKARLGRLRPKVGKASPLAMLDYDVTQLADALRQ